MANVISEVETREDMLFPCRDECVLALGDLAAVMLIQIVRD